MTQCKIPMLKPGDVLFYSPVHSHCRQGHAIVLDSGLVVDTYWDELGGCNNAVLSRDDV